MIEQIVRVRSNSAVKPTIGSAGYETQVCGASATVSNLANATGGIKAGNLVKPSVK